MTKRKIIYVSGTRADYGLMRAVLRKLQDTSTIELSICVTGMHLSALYGNTVSEIEADGFALCGLIPVDVETSTPVSMAQSIGHELIAMTELFARERPDIILLLGDRGEMLAAALAAVHLNIHLVHLHGGERSGTVDEMIRHCISKLAHYHFTATQEAKTRLIQMGERAEHIHVVGAPGLDDLVTAPIDSKEQFLLRYHLKPKTKNSIIGLSSGSARIRADARTI